MPGSGKPKALKSRPTRSTLVTSPQLPGATPSQPAGARPAVGVGVPRFQSFDLLATLVAVVRTSGVVLFANAALEDALGISRRTIEGSQLPDCFTEPHILHNALEGAGSNEFAALRYDAWLKRVNHEPMPVHVVVAQTDTPGETIVELLPLEQQARQDREERLMDQAQANKELIRNLAHEIKNPLGGIRGAAQLLQMEIGKDLTEYTQVIIHEADRLQTLVDRLLAPHRRPHLVGDVNIHEVCERVRSLILAEFPKGLKVVRDYDTYSGFPWRPRAADPGRTEHRPQRLAGAGRTHSSRRCADHFQDTNRPPGHVRQAALPAGTGIACCRQWTGRAGLHQRQDLLSPGVRA